MKPNVKLAESKLMIGNVRKSHHGVATTVCDQKNHVYPIAWINHNMPYLMEDQQVIFYIEQSQAILLYAIEAIEKHKPKQSFQHTNQATVALKLGKSEIKAECSGRLLLRVNQNNITLDETGAIICQASQIKLCAQEALTLECFDNDIAFNITQHLG